ncbi:MAG TPA: sulfite exporter TauE/SafE family protein [Bacillaceae bacterium]
MSIIYFLVGLAASIVGSAAGLGGGVIIKPALDFLDHYDVATIGVLSSATVFSMACVSLLKAAQGGIRVKGATSFTLAAGSVAGGIIGKLVFNHLLNAVEHPGSITVLQARILVVVMILILLFVKYKHRMKTYCLKNTGVIFLTGICLGSLSTFLGIGGGPLNVAILVLAFSMGTKDAAINSIFIIFFSQLSSLILIGVTTGYSHFDLSMLYFMIPGGIIGGFVGTILVKRLHERHIDAIFVCTLMLIILINFYNMVRYTS